MSKKRDKNKRKKLIKGRNSAHITHAKNINNSVLSNLGYTVTDHPIDDSDMRELPLEVQDEIELIYETVLYKPKGAVEKLLKLIESYPQIPQLFNYLYVAYTNTGQHEKAVDTLIKSYENNPDYLFAKLNYSDYLVKQGELEKASDLYQGKFTLDKLYPERNVFHTTEVVCFHGVIGYYFAIIKKYDKARECLEILKELSPEHGYTIRLRRKLDAKSIFLHDSIL